MVVLDSSGNDVVKITELQGKPKQTFLKWLADVKIETADMGLNVLPLFSTLAKLIYITRMATIIIIMKAI
jgi:hypothetical protein